jgi:mannosyl-3-phosphoglycerate phosphatase
MSSPARRVIFTDLDGTLLDESYHPWAAMPALSAIRERGLPLVFCTSKTRAEVEAVRTALDNHDPFIVENGGAIFIPRAYLPFEMPGWKKTDAYDIIELGVPYAQVVAALRNASKGACCSIRGFSDMSAAEIAASCGFSVGAAELARQREYDEPFDVLSDSPAQIGQLLSRIEEEGLTWTRGGRFYHIRGNHNKGQAANILTDLFRRVSPDIVTIGLGDAPNDISLLEAVDVPVFIPSRQGEGSAGWRPGSKFWRLAPAPGPRGWNQAILQLLSQDLSAAGTALR